MGRVAAKLLGLFAIGDSGACLIIEDEGIAVRNLNYTEGGDIQVVGSEEWLARTIKGILS